MARKKGVKAFAFFLCLFSILLINFVSADAIWTTANDCGDSTQDQNHYKIDDSLFINGDKFNPGNYIWEIKGKPGGASCDPDFVVANGTMAVDGDGNFCFNAYNISYGDCGEYQVKFGVKGDNYRVIGNECYNPELMSIVIRMPIFFCGSDSSQLICNGNNVVNQTDSPYCSEEEICEIEQTNVTIQTCSGVESSIYCRGNDLVNRTIRSICLDGGCANSSEINVLEYCENGCEKDECIEGYCGDGVIDEGEECDDGNENNNDECRNDCTTNCIDKDHDGVCDEEDDCLDSKPNEPVDQNGCDIFQFCESFSCTPDCFKADWRANEINEHSIIIRPNDCRLVMVLANGNHLQPRCVPTYFSNSCAN